MLYRALASTESSDEPPEPKRQKNANTGGYRHSVSEYTNGSAEACAEKRLVLYMHRFQSLNANGMRMHQQPSKRPSGSGAGVPPEQTTCQRRGDPQVCKREARCNQTERRAKQSCSSAARSLNAFNMSAETDFDEGVRSLKRGLRDATIADSVWTELQSQAIADHNTNTRRHDNVMNGLPPEIADSFGSNWHLLPHGFKGNLRHLCWSFPAATKAVSTIVSTNPKQPISKTLADKLLAFRRQMCAPAMHTYAPVATDAESRSHDLNCHVAIFCAHGDSGVLVKAMHAKFLRCWMKWSFPKLNKDGRTMLSTGGVVLCTFSEKLVYEQPPTGCYDVPQANFADSEQMVPMLVVVPSNIEASPSIFFGRRMGVNITRDLQCGELRLVSEWQFQKSWEFVRHLEKDQIWYYRLFSLNEAPRVLGTIDASACVVTEL